MGKKFRFLVKNDFNLQRYHVYGEIEPMIGGSGGAGHGNGRIRGKNCRLFKKKKIGETWNFLVYFLFACLFFFDLAFLSFRGTRRFSLSSSPFPNFAFWLHATTRTHSFCWKGVTWFKRNAIFSVGFEKGFSYVRRFVAPSLRLVYRRVNDVYVRAIENGVLT